MFLGNLFSKIIQKIKRLFSSLGLNELCFEKGFQKGVTMYHNVEPYD